MLAHVDANHLLEVIGTFKDHLANRTTGMLIDKPLFVRTELSPTRKASNRALARLWSFCKSNLTDMEVEASWHPDYAVLAKPVSGPGIIVARILPPCNTVVWEDKARQLLKLATNADLSLALKAHK
eukprot:TRINITY_DN102162_c0_g1_i1.p2 TRINITY_DN102162_c0_g1~~TRINITY_DN102162_c0_g1_i1.p2  ORF type:complete len:126 (+),score=11.64 TRINITY_DN102162_c0_g1_i1:218-595(+)